MLKSITLHAFIESKLAHETFECRFAILLDGDLGLKVRGKVDARVSTLAQ